VLALIKDNQQIKAKEMAELTTLSLRTIRNILADLTNQNLLKDKAQEKTVGCQRCK